MLEVIGVEKPRERFCTKYIQMGDGVELTAWRMGVLRFSVLHFCDGNGNNERERLGTIVLAIYRVGIAA